MSNPRPCQGGFCHLHLPTPNNIPSCNISHNSNQSLSKREKRLIKSYQRERAIKVLKWALRDEEYSRLEDNGDLVRLRVNNASDSNSEKNAGYWIHGSAIQLARKEHRPELAQLAFAEFVSQLDEDVICNARDSDPVMLEQPPSQEDDNVLVCGVCSTVYHLLEHARELLTSHDEIQQQQDGEMMESESASQNNDNGECNNGSKVADENVSATINRVDDVPNNSLKRSKTYGAQSKEWGEANMQQSSALQSRSPSFHGPVNTWSNGTNTASFVGRKRDRRKMEMNSKIRILVAESDDTTLKLAKRLLEKQGYKVDTSINGSDCIKFLEKQSYSILLINENLPGKDASSIGRLIRKREELERVTVRMKMLVMVQRILAINYHDYDDLDVDGFLPKPLEGAKLLPSVEKTTAQYFEDVRLAAESEAAEKAKRLALEEQLHQQQPVSSDDITKEQAAKSYGAQSPNQTKPKKRRGKRDKKKKARKSGSKSFESTKKVKRQDPITFESTFQYDNHTSFPYAVLCNGSELNTASDLPSDTGQKQGAPWCNMIICQDVFDTYERFKIFFLPMVARYPGMRILLWNYPGQAFTTFSDDANLNNKFHADCLVKLLEHTMASDEGNFGIHSPFFIMAHGSGASIATYFASAYHNTSLRGLVLVNGLSHVDLHYASVFHDCRNVFSCSPESRPDLPVYFYARFLFSPSYLSKTTSSLALNIYTAVHNPITLNGRKRLCQGVLDHVDTRPLLKDIASPIISVHGENATLVRVMHAAEYLSGRRNCPTIPQALRGGNRTAVVMMKGGHELFQEKKDQIALLIEQILTGYHDKIHEPACVDGANPVGEKVIKLNGGESKAKVVYHPNAKTLEDKFIDNVLKESRGNQSSWDIYQEEIMTEQRSNSQNKPPPHANIIKKEQLQSKPTKENKEFDPNEYPEVKEYMAWRIRRHKKRLAALDQSARVIQSALRCFMAKTMINRVRREKAANIIQCCTRGCLGRKIYRMKKKELWAARFVQRTLRGHNARCISYSKRMERNAQINVARMLRGITARRRFQAVIKKREWAATKIQSLCRMHAAVLLKKYHRKRRESSIMVQKIYKGHRGRRKAALERDKYIFSRSQNSGIEIGRQLLAEHKLHATKIQSELSLLNQDKDKMEKQIEFHLSEISHFDQTISGLERKMHELSKFERETFGVLASPRQVQLQEEKRRMDEEFSETLDKISDRKAKLEQLESTFEQLMRTRQEKFGQLKSLEGKLAVLLDAQDSALERIRRKKDENIDSVLQQQRQNSQSASSAPSHAHRQLTIPAQLPGQNDAADIYHNYGPSERDKTEAAKLIDSTEQMMKFGFMSMSLTYFSSLNMMKAMQKVGATETMTHPGSSPLNPSQYAQQAHSVKIQQSQDKAAAVKVESWSINDVSKWLVSISLSQYQSAFKEGAVDGSFLCELTDDDLKNTLGVAHRLHRKKLLFSIHCLKSYAEAHSSYSSPSPMPMQHPQPQHYGMGGDKGDASALLSPNMALYEGATHDAMTARGSNESYYSSNDRQYEVSVASPSKSSSVLDILTPSKIENRNVPLCDSEQLRSWVRHQKHENIREALNNVADAPFQTRHIRVQFTEDIGTSYTLDYEREPFSLNKGDEHGNTLMHIAAQTGNIRIGKLLIRKGANPNHQNKQGQTPGHFAVAYHFFDFASWLFDERGGGADDLLTNMYDLGPYDGLE